MERATKSQTLSRPGLERRVVNFVYRQRLGAYSQEAEQTWVGEGLGQGARILYTMILLFDHLRCASHGRRVYDPSLKAYRADGLMTENVP